MKKIFALIFSVSVLLTSCSKEQRINRQLDGEWKVTKFAGIAITEDVTYKFHKSNQKGQGDWTIKYASGGDGGKYVISGDKITITTNITNTGPGGGTTTESQIYTINEHSRKKFKMTSTGGDVIEMEKK